MSDLDVDVEDFTDETDVEFDPSWGTSTFHNEISSRCADALGASQDQLDKLSSNVFIKDAISSAVFLRSIYGDADGVIADHCENIRTNLMVVLTEINKDPVSFIACIAQAIPDTQKRKEWLAAVGAALLHASSEL